MNRNQDFRSIEMNGGQAYGSAYGAADMPVPVISAAPAERAAFLRKVYVTLTAGVAISLGTGIALLISAIGNESHILWKMAGGKSFLVLMLAYLALTFMVGSVISKRGINVIAYALFTAFTGFVISPLLLFAVIKTGGFSVIWQALGLTGFAFGGLSFYAIVSGKDFSFMKGFLWTGFWIMLGLIVVGFFVQSWAFSMAVTALGLLVFIGFVLYDTSQIMRNYSTRDWVAGAFQLFIDFINMFTRVLMLLTGRRE